MVLFGDGVQIDQGVIFPPSGDCRS